MLSQYKPNTAAKNGTKNVFSILRYGLWVWTLKHIHLNNQLISSFGVIQDLYEYQGQK